jgi:hypothetical protein
MEKDLIFLPVLIQVALTFWLYIYLAITKSRAMKLGQVNEARRSLHDDAWPDYVLQVNNCIRNQFEVPILFYVLVIVLWCTDSINVFIHVLAWCFVLSRIIHAIIHTGSNYVPLRRKMFMLGCIVLMMLTVFSSYAILRL